MDALDIAAAPCASLAGSDDAPKTTSGDATATVLLASLTSSPTLTSSPSQQNQGQEQEHEQTLKKHKILNSEFIVLL